MSKIESSYKSLVPPNTTFKKSEESLSSPFGFGNFYGKLLQSLRISGAYIPDFQKRTANQKSNLFSNIVNIACVSAIALIAIRNGVHVCECFGRNDFWTALFDLLLSLNAFWSTVLLARNQQLLHRCLHQSIVYVNLSEDQKSLEKLSDKLTHISWSLIALRIAFDAVYLLQRQTLNDYIRLNYPLDKLVSKSLVSDNPIAIFAIALIDAVVHRVFILGATQFASSLFIILVAAMKKKFDTFNKFFVECAHRQDVSLSGPVLQNWRVNRCDLHEILIELDDLYSPAVLIWFAVFVLGVCVETMQLFTGDTTKQVWGEKSEWAVNVSYLCFWFALICHYSIAMSDSANRSLFILQTCLGSQHRSDCQYYIQAEALMKQLIKPRLSITCWRYFNVDKSAVLTTIGSIFTYFVLIVEFNPTVKAKIQGKY